MSRRLALKTQSSLISSASSCRCLKRPVSQVAKAGQIACRHLANCQIRTFSSPSPAGKRRNPKIGPKANFDQVKDPNGWVIEGVGEISPQPTDSNLELFHPGNGQRLVLSRQWLRDACDCERCIDPYSGQKTFSTTDIPYELSIQETRKAVDGSLQVLWGQDFHSSGREPHVSQYSAATVKSWFTGDRQKPAIHVQQTLWDKEIFAESPSMVKYDDWMEGGDVFHAALVQLFKYGLLFLHGVPKSEDSVVSTATKIGHIMETFYGRSWDVRSKPQAENVAYTSSYLGLHQDLLYTLDPPRIQLLHCLENTCEGGESIFSDSRRAHRLMRLGPSRHIQALERTKLRYQYNKNGQFYERLRPVLPKIPRKRTREQHVFWSPPFQASDQPRDKTEAGSMEYLQFLTAAKKFRALLEDEHWVYEYKLKPGQCVIFDNLRVLHGRRRFDTSSGSRWLKGTYVSSDAYISKLRTLGPQLQTMAQDNHPTTWSKQADPLRRKYNVWASEDKAKSGQ